MPSVPPWILGLFLYFPEDKSEYIPAAISFGIFFVFAVLTMMWIIRINRKQEKEAKLFEQQLQAEEEQKRL
ncbi:hypothetical protein [Bacillus fonticola]|uniref:hypothetical protein n=1 Tax=Bacillus fonticola TaxID=2728853 RepID=UPI0014743B04|nr:hypothetical protein [Bacillus fonticola]